MASWAAYSGLITSVLKTGAVVKIKGAAFGAEVLELACAWHGV
jgi:hypothetical protein